MRHDRCALCDTWLTTHCLPFMRLALYKLKHKCKTLPSYSTGPLFFMLNFDTKQQHQPAPAPHLTCFATRVAVFRHRAASHVLEQAADQTTADRNDWNTAMEVLPAIRVHCRYAHTQAGIASDAKMQITNEIEIFDALIDALYSKPGVNMRFEIVCLPSSSSHPCLGFVSPSNFISSHASFLFFPASTLIRAALNSAHSLLCHNRTKREI